MTREIVRNIVSYLINSILQLGQAISHCEALEYVARDK